MKAMNRPEMKIRYRCLLELIPVIIIFTLLTSCCSLFGLGLGALVDADSPVEYDTLSTGDAAALKSGDAVKVIQRDSSDVCGTYLRIYRVPLESYASAYEPVVASGAEKYSLPALGERVHVSLARDGQMYEGTMLGFGNRRMWIQADSCDSSARIPLTSIAEISSNGRFYSAESISSRLESGEIPQLFGIAVEDSTGLVQVPMERVARILVRDTPNSMLTGFCVGAALDVTALVVMVRRIGPRCRSASYTYNWFED